MYTREYGFLCNVYQKGVKRCQAAEPNQYIWHSIDVLKSECYQFHKTDSDEDDEEELEEIDMFLESDVTKYSEKGNGIICTAGDHNCYLAKLITNIYEIEESEKDDNNHEMLAYQKGITCSYLEIIKI